MGSAYSRTALRARIYAKYFHLLITNILNIMIIGGVLGPIKAYFGTVESQGRGSLIHLHLLIWLDHDMRSGDLREKNSRC